MWIGIWICMLRRVWSGESGEKGGGLIDVAL